MTQPWSSLRKELGQDQAFDTAYEEVRLAYEISVVVRQAREKRGLTQTQLAERMGTRRSAIARLEGGGVTPTLPTLKRVAKRWTPG